MCAHTCLEIFVAAKRTVTRASNDYSTPPLQAFQKVSLTLSARKSGGCREAVRLHVPCARSQQPVADKAACGTMKAKSGNLNRFLPILTFLPYVSFFFQREKGHKMHRKRLKLIRN